MRWLPHDSAGLKMERAKQEGMWVASRSREPPSADSQQDLNCAGNWRGAWNWIFFPESSIRTWTNEILSLDL